MRERRLVRAVATLAFVLAIAGCRHASPPAPVTPPMPPLAERIHGLPALPSPLSQASPSFQRLFEGIDVALEDRIPLPDLRSETDYRAWVEHDLATWLGRRARAIEEAEARLSSVHYADGSFEGILGSALVGYLFEQTARDVLATDLPSMREERARAIRAAWREQMAPMLARGGAYFARCAEQTRAPPEELSAWASACRDHAVSDAADAGEGANGRSRPLSVPTTSGTAQERP